MCLYLDSGTDDYYVLEADLSSTGGYVNLINISVPISMIRFLGLTSNFFTDQLGHFFAFCLVMFANFPLVLIPFPNQLSFTDQLQPEVIQRRSSITAPMSPRSSTTTTIITIIYSTIVTTTNSPSRSSPSSTTSTSIKTITISITTNRASLPQFCFIWLMFWDRIYLLL